MASLLEETAAAAQRRGGTAAAARALERAAQLSLHEQEEARRLLAAAALAVPAGQADWVQDLATRVLAVTADPEQRILARMYTGWALAWSNQHADALATLLSVTAEASATMPDVAWRAIGLAGTVAYQSGMQAAREAERNLEARALVERAMARVDPAPGPRLEQLAARARRLLAHPAAEPAGAEAGVDKVRPSRRLLAIRARPAATGPRGMAPAAAADQRREAGPRSGARDLPSPGRHTVDQPCAGGTPRLRRDHAG